jgi:pimeloyl-ACP methyl ester carboxylesterase
MSPSPLPASDPEHERELHQVGAKLAGLEVAEFVLPEHHHAVLHGMRFHYLDWGTRGKPPVLLLHGGGQTARTWDLCALALRPRLHCLALDQRGHGDSEWAYDFAYAPDDHAQDFAALLDHLGIARAIVVGMSMGCLNGLCFSARWPERVAAFVAVDAGPWVQMEGGRRIADFVRGADGAQGLDDWVAAAQRFNPRRDPRLLRQSLLHNLRALPDGKLTWKTDRRRPIDLGAIEGRLATLREKLDRIRCPVLILRGAESDVFSDEDAARFAAALPDARWTSIAGAGHAIQGDKPAELVREVAAFLAERGLA